MSIGGFESVSSLVMIKLSKFSSLGVMDVSCMGWLRWGFGGGVLFMLSGFELVSNLPISFWWIGDRHLLGLGGDLWREIFMMFMSS